MRLTGFSALRGVPRNVALAAALASLLLFATPVTGAADPGTGDPGTGEPPAPTSDPAAAEAIAVLDAVTASLDDVPAEHRGHADPDGTTLDLSSQLAELVSVYDELPGPEQRTADRILARPTDGSDPLGLVSYAGVDAEDRRSTCNTRICVHWVTSGKHKATASWAGTVLDQVDHVWQAEVGSMGYAPPVSDGTMGNPDGVSGTRLDVYLGEISNHGAYGYAATDNPDSGAAYLILDDDYSNFAGNALDLLRVTAAHEFFHAIQFGYRADAGIWFMETTATWIEEQVHDGIDDNRQYLKRKNPLTNPGRSLDKVDQGIYGGWIFFEHLSQRHGPAVVRDMWTRVGNGAAPMKSIKKTLKARGTSLRKEFARFAASNTIPAKTYAEGRFYPRAKPAKKPKLGKKRRATGWQSHRVNHLSAQTVRFRPAGKLGKKWRLKATVKGPARLQVELLALRTNGNLTRKQVKVTRGKQTIGATFSTSKVKWVAVTVANTSPKTKHDATKFKIRGKLRKK